MHKVEHGWFSSRTVFFSDRFKRPFITLGSTPVETAIRSTPPFRSKVSVRPKPSSQSRPSEQNVKLNTPSPARRLPAFSNRDTSNSMPAHSPSSNSTPSAIAPSSPKSTAGISIQQTPIRRHSAPTIHQHAFLNLPSSQQGSAPSLTPLPQTGDTPTVIPFLSRAPGPSVVPNLPSTTNRSGPQHTPSAGVDLLHALNYAFQIQNTASQAQNAASQTLTQLVETVIAVAQSQGMDTAIIQNYLATLPMSSSAIQQSPPSNVHEPILHSVDEYQGTSVSDPPYQDGGKSSARTHTPRVVSPEPSLPAKRRRKSLESLFPAKRPASDSRQDPSGAYPEPPQSERGVFSTKNGRPILVFVQIDTRGRHGIVHLIKVSPQTVICTIRCKCPTEKRRENYGGYPQSSIRHSESSIRYLQRFKTRGGRFWADDSAGFVRHRKYQARSSLGPERFLTGRC